MSNVIKRPDDYAMPSWDEYQKALNEADLRGQQIAELRSRAEKAEARIARMEPVAALAAKIVEDWEYMDAESLEFFELIKKMRTAIEKHEEVEP